MIARTTLAAILCAASFQDCIAQSSIHFDLPATSPAVDVTAEPHAGNTKLVSIDLDLSLIVDELSAPSVEQLLIQLVPLGGSAMIADYAPRTEFASHFATDIEVSSTKETTDRLGLSIDGTYGQLARANIGADHGEKNAECEKFSRVAPMHVVASSGTTRRGRGVYFKLRADERQVLEGNRRFNIVLRVPASWRGELIDVRVEAESTSRSFSASLSSLTGGSRRSMVVGAARFLVATHLADDPPMSMLANDLGDTEITLRNAVGAAMRATESQRRSPFNHVAFRLDITGPDPVAKRQAMARVMSQVIFADVDPHFDREIASLPMSVRVAILDYLDAKKAYQSMSAE